MQKGRLDLLLVERGLVESRAKAQALIMAGRVRVEGQVELKASCAVPPDAVLSLETGPRFVSRGGDKLEAALSGFQVDVSGRVCADVGASTGGFTDCLLQHGAARVYAVDVGHGQLHWRLRNDPRVVLKEGINARYLRPGDLPEQPALAAVDVSFISLTKILPAVKELLAMGGEIVALIKPQFEAGRKQVGKGGVVRDAGVQQQVIGDIREFGTQHLGLEWLGVCVSPLKGPAGNVEFLAHWKRP